MSTGVRVGLILLALAAVLGGLAWGVRQLYDSGYDAGKAAALAEAQEQFDAQQVKDRAQADRLLKESRAKAQAAGALAERLKQEVIRGRIDLVRTEECAAGGDRAGAVPGGDAGAAGGTAVAGETPDAPGGDAQLPTRLDRGPAVRLSAHALRLWNSALAGRDVPVGACGSADPTAGACAAGVDTTLDEAWANHITNATSCAIDRARLAQLIEFLRRRDAPATP